MTTPPRDADAVLVPQPDTVPGPYPSTVSAPYWDAARRHELWFQRCGACASAVFDPAIVCRRCGASDLAWERSAGVGSVYSWTVVWRPQQPAFVVPYAPAIIELDEGYQMLASIVGCCVGDLGVGRRVAVEFHPVAGGYVLPCFRHV